MCAFKISKKPNVLNLQFKFWPPPLGVPSEGGAKKLFALPRFILVYALVA